MPERLTSPIINRACAVEISTHVPDYSPLRLPVDHIMPGFTERQVQVAGFVALGLDNNTIAEELSIAPKTVARHLGDVRQSIGVADRYSLVAALNHFDAYAAVGIEVVNPGPTICPVEANLTPRELDTLQAHAFGLSTKQAARVMGVCTSTVERFHEGIHTKTGIRKKDALMPWLLASGVVFRFRDIAGLEPDSTLVHDRFSH